MQQQTAEGFEPRKLARTTDPNTSHEAASRVGEFGNRHHAIIRAVLRQRGDGTAHEIAEQCDLEAHAIGKRLDEMWRAKMIDPVLDEKTGLNLTRPTPSGRSARVWKLAAT